ncbi:LysR family transcriptional regulator [Nocardia sp. NPDC052001]|uniref:LysR family transcriptional regulator n=1 Tax=Nocardia sp. NPDC052001 TaxID=3154853 RepID=UPI003412B7D5
MELRDIEIFLTLAEELHFGRTAERLHLTSPRVSQSIKAQERAIGTALFTRTSRVVRLTRAGEQLRDGLQPIYRNLNEVLAEAKRAAREEHAVLRVGVIASNAHDLRPYFDTFTARHQSWRLHVRHNPFVDAFGPLRRGEIDVLISWLPVQEPDLTVGPVVFTEDRVLAVAADHALALRDSVSLEVLGDFSVATGPDQPGYWQDAFHPFATPRGRRVERDGQVTNMDELSTLIGLGRSVNLLGEHASRFHARPDLAYVPVSDAPRLQWAMIWAAGGDTEPVRALARVVTDLGTRAI